MKKHKIAWTEQTWNPIIGCSRISSGCENCYAEKMANRLAFIDNTAYYRNVVKFDNYVGGNEFENKDKWFDEVWNGKTHFVKSQLEKPFKWKNPRMIFVCSMGDLFHESVPFEWIDEVIARIAISDQHIFQLLTKRPDRMRDYFSEFREDQIRNIWWNKYKIYTTQKRYVQIPDNIWLGVTAENQIQAIKRIPTLLDIPAKIKFVSIEPMLSEINLIKLREGISLESNALNGECYSLEETYQDINNRKLNWVICGGESGSNARPMHPDWVRSLRDQCESANVPFFFKQWGEWIPTNERKAVHDNEIILVPEGKGVFFTANPNAKVMRRIGKKKAGCLLDGKEYKQFPKLT